MAVLKIANKYTIHHVVVFWLTFASYMFVHGTRKTFSNLKSTMQDVWMPQNDSDMLLEYDHNEWNGHRFFTDKQQATDFMGILDAVFMFAYAVGLYISGVLGDRFDPRVVLAGGMLVTAVINIIFGYVVEVFNFYSMPLYVCIWIVNGFAQSTPWPPAISIMGNWFGRHNRGLITGIWCTCSSVGNILGAYICAAVLPCGYEFAFLVNSSLLFGGGIMVYFGLVTSPAEIGLSETNDDADNAEDAEEQEKHKASKAIEAGALGENARQKPISFFRAVLLPGVILYSVAYAGLKLVNYSIFFWLPFYMHANFGWTDDVSAQVSTYYDWGGIIGSTLGGLVSDYLGKRSPVVVVQLVVSVLFLGVYSQLPDNKEVNSAVMGIVGFFVNGAANLISAAVTGDIGKHEAVANNAEALSTISGIVEGTGSAAAAIGQVVIPEIENWLGWNSVFYMFIILLLVSALILSRLCYRETREIIRNVKARLAAVSSDIGHTSNQQLAITVASEKTAL